MHFRSSRTFFLFFRSSRWVFFILWSLRYYSSFHRCNNFYPFLLSQHCATFLYFWNSLSFLLHYSFYYKNFILSVLCVFLFVKILFFDVVFFSIFLFLDCFLHYYSTYCRRQFVFHVLYFIYDFSLCYFYREPCIVVFFFYCRNFIFWNFNFYWTIFFVVGIFYPVCVKNIFYYRIVFRIHVYNAFPLFLHVPLGFHIHRIFKF